MIQLAILSLLTGAVLGLRSRVNSLIGATVVIECSVGGLSLIAGQSIATTLLTIVTSASALQAGYLIGTVTRFVIAGARSSARTPATVPTRAAHFRAD